MIYSQILDLINQNIKQNGKEDITGNILNSVLRSLLDFINSQNKSFNGILTENTKPNNTTKGFWFATEGVFPKFGISVPKNNLGIIYWENGYKVDLIDLVDEQALKDYIDQQLVNINLGFGGEITSLNQFPTIDGMYIPKVIGIYPNFGNLEYLLSDGFVVFLYKNGVFSKVNIPLDINIENNVNYDSNNVVSGSAVEKYAVKKVNTITGLRNTYGEYDGQIITLLGYYETGDKQPLNYKYQNTQLIDDGGSVINNVFGSWVATFTNNINVDDFGAKGDSNNLGIGNDDSSSFKNALKYLKQKKGGVLNISSRSYLITDTITLYDYITIRGVNGGILEYKNNNSTSNIIYNGDNDLFKIEDTSGNIHDTIFFNGIKDLNIITLKDVVVFNLTSVQFAKFDNVCIRGSSKKGTGVTGYSDGSFNVFNNCIFEDLNYGVRPILVDEYPFDDNNFTNCYFFVNNIAVELNRESDSNKFIGCSFAYNNIDIHLDNSYNNFFDNIRIENNKSGTVKIGAKSANNYLNITGMISTSVNGGSLFDGIGVNNSINILQDTSHYGVALDFYPLNTFGNYTANSPINMISDGYTISDIYKEYGSVISDNYEAESFRGYRVKKIVNSNNLSYYSIKINPKFYSFLKKGDEVTASIWVKTDGDSSKINNILRLMQIKTDSSDVESYTAYTHPNDNDFHLCKIVAVIDKDYDHTKINPIYLRLYLEPSVEVYITSPYFSMGNTINTNPISLNKLLDVKPTSLRPNLIEKDKGYMFYDSTLNKPIWWNGVNWSDSQGLIV